MSRLDRKFRRQGMMNRGVQLPPVDAVPGMAAGFLLGSTVAGGRTWDVVFHPDEKEYTLRQQGCDETSGIIATLSEGETAGLSMKVGVKFLLTAPPKELAKVPLAIITKAQGYGYALTLQAFAEELITMINAQMAKSAGTEGGTDQPHQTNPGLSLTETLFGSGKAPEFPLPDSVIDQMTLPKDGDATTP